MASSKRQLSNGTEDATRIQGEGWSGCEQKGRQGSGEHRRPQEGRGRGTEADDTRRRDDHRLRSDGRQRRPDRECFVSGPLPFPPGRQSRPLILLITRTVSSLSVLPVRRRSIWLGGARGGSSAGLRALFPTSSSAPKGWVPARAQAVAGSGTGAGSGVGAVSVGAGSGAGSTANAGDTCKEHGRGSDEQGNEDPSSPVEVCRCHLTDAPPHDFQTRGGNPV